jgi:molybdenum cofactor cytidylyltransferase
VSVALILLAAGGSQRLGQPKQLLDYHGKPLLRHAAETALGSSCRPVIVVLGAAAEACAEAIKGLAVTTVVNASWPSGLSYSIRCGLAVLERDFPNVTGVILSVGDQPHLTSALLDSLIEQHKATRKKIIAAQYAGVPGPPALFCSRLFSQLKTLTGDEGARRVLVKNSSEVVLVPFPNGSVDVDTSADYDALKQPPGH